MFKINRKIKSPPILKGFFVLPQREVLIVYNTIRDWVFVFFDKVPETFVMGIVPPQGSFTFCAYSFLHFFLSSLLSHLYIPLFLLKETNITNILRL